jgi:hypothetical protein
MRKILILLIFLPMIGFSQFGKYTSSGQFGVYWNTNLTEWWNHIPINARAYDVSTTQSYYDSETSTYVYASNSVTDSIVSYNLLRGSVGFFYNFKSKLVFNKRINLGADYFYYYPSALFKESMSENYEREKYISVYDKYGNVETSGEGGNRRGYLRITTGLGIPVWYFKSTSTDFNINNIMYIGPDAANTIDVNLTFNAGICQVIMGYETSAKLSADFRNYYLTDSDGGYLEESENYVQFPNFYIALRLGLSVPVGDGTWLNQAQYGTAQSTYSPKPTTGCIKGNCNNGKGVYVNNQGRYKGRFKNGKHHGQGVMSFSDGSSYDGKWRSGNRHGKGTYISKYMEELAGDWIDDEFADPKLKPELTISNIVFIDSDGDDEIYAEESGRINFELENIGNE